MYKGHKIRVIVPAYNEEKLITDTLRSIPVFVDSIFVINDASSDNTFKLILDQKEKDRRIDIIDHKKNMGLGPLAVMQPAYKESNCQGLLTERR